MAVSCDQPSVTGQDVAAHLCIGRVCAWRQCRMQTVCCLVPSETQTCPSVCLVSQQRRGMTIRCLVESWRFKQQFSWTNNFRCALLHQRSNWLDRPTLHIFAPRDDYVFSMTRQLPALIQCMFPPRWNALVITGLAATHKILDIAAIATRNFINDSKFLPGRLRKAINPRRTGV